MTHDKAHRGAVWNQTRIDGAELEYKIRDLRKSVE